MSAEELLWILERDFNRGIIKRGHEKINPDREVEKIDQVL
jgi:hypothetical protein